MQNEIFADDPKLDEKITTYLSAQDIYSNPLLKENKQKAEILMQLRFDNEGDLIKRAILGDKDSHKYVTDKIE
jgi:hypothetical protein